MSVQGLASRSSFSATASRMNLARPYVPTSASMAASISADMRTGVGFMSSGGRPMGRGVAVDDAGGKKTIPFSIDGLNGTDYINGIVYGGKMMTYTAAMNVCAFEHKQNRDIIGERAIAVMLNKPRSEHRIFAERQRPDIRDTCLNAIAFAEQESAS